MFVFKAFCETLEETNYRLQKELLEKQKELESLRKALSAKQVHIDTLEGRLRCVAPAVPAWAPPHPPRSAPSALCALIRFRELLIPEVMASRRASL